ncbi:cytochrome P450 [Streptomyces sporangiiformans]|uniref:Cytochrome P450 n=1 Tax=Streptomyces sporangiiformans TaxID=2315329 RepID=A0A505D3D6_9ACTN|nr:cytochrome P450 [Streptomyces sporangiiformans]TPQ16135.1 cytochrome P450 [Streptomyces sporangiiformans]
MTTEQVDSPKFPFEGDVFVEPDPRYAELRAGRPVCPVTVQNGKRAWLITRYEDARAALTDPRFTRGGTLDAQTVQAMGVAGPAGRMALIYADPPLLTESRGLVSRYFNARRVESLRPRAQEIVDGLIDRMEATGGPVDLLESLARPLPIQIICELLGIPVTDSDAIRHSVELLMHIEGTSGDEIRDAFTHVYGYLGTYVGRLREKPGDDLLSDLILDGADDGTSLSDSELVGLAMLLFVTGHETTMTQMVNSCLVLLQSDEQRTRLLDHPGLIDTCVEELLRFVPLGHAGLPFAAGEDLEFRDVKMSKGELVFVSKLSANRDESAFDAAGTLDIGRTPNRHIAFSHGPHYCLGAALARMELRVAIGTLFSRLPTLRLAVDPEELVWRVGSIQRGPVGLPVTW